MRNTVSTRLIFEMSREGRRGARFPAVDTPSQSVEQLIPADQLADASTTIAPAS